MHSSRWRPGLVWAALIIIAPSWSTAQPAAVTPGGLSISPLRDYVTIRPGSVTAGQLVVGNRTETEMSVTISAENFSVSDYAYDYAFAPSKDSVISFSRNQLRLAAGTQETVGYTITIPKDSPAGGKYYSLFAIAQVSSGGFTTTLQAASLLYMTVEGAVTAAGRLEKAYVPRFATGGSIPYYLDIQNSGNTHYFTDISAGLDGVIGGSTMQSNGHIIMPGTTRRLQSRLPAPKFPGLYTVTFGYTAGSGETSYETRRIWYVPVWGMIVAVAVLVALPKLLHRVSGRRRY